MTLTIDTRIKDNDERFGANRAERTIKAFIRHNSGIWENASPKMATHVVAVALGRPDTRIRINRIHTDEKVRKSGWSVVP